MVNLPDQKQLDKQQAGKPQEVSPGWGVQQGDTRAAAFGPWPEGGGSCWAGFAYFSYLMLNVEELCISGRPVYPVERCLLVSHAGRCSAPLVCQRLCLSCLPRAPLDRVRLSC